MDYLKQIREYVPYNEQEEQEKKQIMEYAKLTKDLLTRNNKIAHFTASSIALNKQRDQMLMVYHNIWQDWCWTGGHVDGETDFLKVAIKELKEETGVIHVAPIQENIASLDIIPAWGHYKNGEYVVPHLHLNVTYLLEVEKKDYLHSKQDENQQVRWIAVDRYKRYSKQKTMYSIYDKVIEKMTKYGI